MNAPQLLLDAPEHYRIGLDVARARMDFRAAFGLDIQYFYDGVATFCFKRLSIDVFKLDEYLYSVHEDYVDGVNMWDIVRKHYGEFGVAVLRRFV